MCRKLIMVMPPIYRFEFSGNPDLSAWGWHRASDLVAVTNNLREIAGLPKLTAYEIGTEYPIGKSTTATTYFIEGNTGALLGLATPPDSWLHNAVIKRNRFLPAKLGMLLLQKVKNPNKVIKKPYSWWATAPS